MSRIAALLLAAALVGTVLPAARSAEARKPAGAPATIAPAAAPFDAGTPALLRRHHRGAPFILALWSVRCEPCRAELAHWSRWQARSAIPVILVSTDEMEDQPAASALLQRHALGGVHVMAFADQLPERIRFAIDPQWHGELPRTYFFDASHRVVAHSGALDPVWVEDWLTRHARP